MEDKYEGWNRTGFKEKVDLAKEIKDNSIIDIQEVKRIIEQGMTKASIDGEVCIINGIENIKKWKKDNEDNEYVIFVKFTMCGHVAVVGAGVGDLRFPPIDKKNCTTTKILNALKNDDNKMAYEWNKNKVIVVSVDGITEESLTKKDPELGKRIKTVDNVLKCRKGVEYFVGELLLDKNVPILNTYSHRNWKYDFWKSCKSKNYKYD